MNDKRRFTSEGERIATAEPEVKYRVRPRGEWVLIKQLLKETEEANGVLLPGEDFFMLAGKGKTQRGEVIEAGPKSDLKAGDKVIFTYYPLEIEGLKDLVGTEEIKLVRDEEVYAVYEPCQ